MKFFGPLAQPAEQGTLNAKAGGSIPPRPTLFFFTRRNRMERSQELRASAAIPAAGRPESQ